MPNSQVYAVVKANAYGHGIERVYQAFKSADGFALLDLAEAKRIRALGWIGPVLLLEGFRPEQYRQVWQQLSSLPQVQRLTHMMHFSDADGERFGREGIAHQCQLFDAITHDLPGARSVSNSAAILRHEQLQSDVIRSGIMLYGSSPDYPSHSIQDWDLQPAMSLRSELIAIQQLKAGDSVGYGSKFIAESDMRVGIVACGYADGYQRITATGTPILVDGQRSSLVGRVSMDMLAVDLSHLPNAQVGSEVVLWGTSKQGAVLSIDEVAAGSGTIGYELMCAVTARVNFIQD
ncbi:hypothetical protein LTR94_020958 [Friedmanniomyces endolithicus]|nr:hypothetical protein LTR94_020958 [Friedmanniomyces endolithicus]